MAKRSKKSDQIAQVQEVDTSPARMENPYCHELIDTLNGWTALQQRIDELKKRADKIHLSYLMTEEDVAGILSLDKTWLSERRNSGEPPFYYKLGKGKRAPVRYSLSEVMDYLAICCRRKSTSDDSVINIEEAEAEYFDKYDCLIDRQLSRSKRFKGGESCSQIHTSQQQPIS